jgi:hypothetical protein
LIVMYGSAGRPTRDVRLVGILLLCAAFAVACSVPIPGRGGAPTRREGPVISDPEAWQRVNLPLVQEYLLTLPESQRGQSLGGILLSDGTRWFEGYTYLGAPQSDHPGLQVRLLRDPRGRVRAYLRLDEGSDPYPLGPCTGSETPGIRARQLTGEVHAWYALAPEHGFVYTVCPLPEWLADVGADAVPPEPAPTP